MFDQDPKFGQRVDEGSTVQLKVSAGAPAIPVPDVIGAQVEQARQRLTADGFTVKEEQVVDEAAPVGEVVDQDPGPNEEAPRGSEVTIFVSKRSGRPTRAGRRGQDDRRGLQPARPGGLRRQPDLRALRAPSRRVASSAPTRRPTRCSRRARRSRWSCRAARRRASSPTSWGNRRRTPSTSSAGTGFRAVVEEVATDDPTQDGRVVDQNPDGQHHRRQRLGRDDLRRACSRSRRSTAAA